jgi:indole-3-glycerol phosphate synthase
MNILDKIISDQKKLVAQNKSMYSIEFLKSSLFYGRACLSLADRINANTYPSIIAEFKRKSPSKPDIKANADINTIPQSYQKSGASAVSILTNSHYFGGSDQDMSAIRNHITIPVLRKEFIIDAYQLYEAKSIGADLVLLIAEALTKDSCHALTLEAKTLGMEVILELHAVEEIDKINDHIDFIGINNRDLKNFNTSIETSLDLLASLPSDKIKISESGIHHPEDAIVLWNAGYKAFLIGEQFMKHSDPGAACSSFIQTIKRTIDEN